MSEFIAGLYAGLKDVGAFDRPYVLLGHSLGAAVAYELCATALSTRESLGRAGAVALHRLGRPPAAPLCARARHR